MNIARCNRGSCPFFSVYAEYTGWVRDKPVYRCNLGHIFVEKDAQCLAAFSEEYLRRPRLGLPKWPETDEDKEKLAQDIQGEVACRCDLCGAVVPDPYTDDLDLAPWSVNLYRRQHQRWSALLCQACWQKLKELLKIPDDQLEDFEGFGRK